MQDREIEVDKTVHTRSGGSQADPERILGPLEVGKGLQNHTFDDKPALLASKNALWERFLKKQDFLMKNDAKMIGFWMKKHYKMLYVFLDVLQMFSGFTFFWKTLKNLCRF